MADKKISQLGATTVPVNADLFAIVQSGVTKKITYQNLVAAIISETSLDLNQVLTNGNITGGKNIIVTNGDVIKSTDNKAGLSISTGGSVEISSSNFDGTESFIYVDSTSAALYSQGSQGFSTDASRVWVLHSAEVRLDAPIVRIVDNLITSGTANKTEMYFGASGDNFDVSTDGGTNAESRILLTPTTNGIYFAGDGYIEVTASETRLFHDTKLLLNAPIYNFSQLTASTIPYLDASKNLISSAITPTELGYLSGATSGLQAQIDALVTGLSWKQAVRVATTGPGTLASSFENGDTIDGVILITGDRILIKDQAAATENGIYVVNASGAPTRASDMNVAAEFPSATVAVSAGTTNADTQWVCSNDSVTIGVTNITFVAVGGTTYVGTINRITVTGNVIDISATFEALLGKVASPLSQFASTTSAQLASIISDETGSGSLVFGTAPTLSNPVVGTQSSGDNSTKAASTAFVVEARAIFDYYSDTSTNTPGDNGTFYSGTLNNYAAETGNSYSFQSPKTNTIFKGTMWAEVRGTLGTTENSVIKLQNITQGTEETLGNLKHSRKLNYLTFTSTLANTVGDEMIFQGTNPAWSTNPTIVHYSWNIKGY